MTCRVSQLAGENAWPRFAPGRVVYNETKLSARTVDNECCEAPLESTEGLARDVGT
jgi:hypothetical protein